jgi:hypothetical protein
MKQISEVAEKTVHVVFKYLSRSLLRKGYGKRSNASPHPSPPPYSTANLVDISFKDDVAVILLLCVYLLGKGDY